MTDAYERLPEIKSLADDPGLPERLHAIWETKPGIYGWFSTVDHKKIGIRYLVTSFLFLLAGGIEALFMRIQLAGPAEHVLTADQYNQIFSMHGITMIFLYALPVLSGFSNYLFPLVLGSRDMAFPRLNAFSYWVYLAAGIFMYASFLTGAVPNDGWFNYAPYSLKPFNPGPNMDFYALGMVFLGISTTVGAINFLGTVLRLRAPGMSINRLPILVWGTSTISVGVLLAMPAVSLSFLLLYLDRQFGTHFYDSSRDGSPMLWQHLFWIFAHPWVYIIVLPAMGLVSDALPILCRRPIVGYTLVVLGTVTTMALGFGVWVHHMFATGLPPLAASFFSGASMIITIPSAIAVFAWVATIWTGKPVFTTAFHYFAAFISMFVIGGVSGVMTASVPADYQLTDTYFVVAHLHYVLIGINLFGVLGALYFWVPKMSGHMLNERLGKFAFWLVLIGFNVTFLPMHLSGIMGMPRRIYTYPAETGWGLVNLIDTIGAFLLALGLLLVAVNVLRGIRRGPPAGNNPWDAPTLEWLTPSPPPPYNFAIIPAVASRHPLWEERLNEGSGKSSLDRGYVLDHGKEALGTTVLDALPDVILKMPEDSPWPFLTTLALSLFFTGMLVQQWIAFGVGLVLIFAAIGFWLWPKREKLQIAAEAPHG